MFSAGQMLADYNLINSCPGRDEDNLELTGAVGRDRDTGHQDQQLVDFRNSDTDTF